MKELPKLSLPGNLLLLGVNGAITYYAWRAGGWWKALAVINAMSGLYTIGQISKQI